MQTTPAVSVLMPVYNAERFVEKAIRSVLNQGFREFELVLVNDGSKDQSVEIIESIQDPRIRLIHNEKNMGLACVRNRLLELAQGEYIAWLDSDDYSEPGRLQAQFDYLESRPQAVLCGGFVRPFNHDSGRRQRIWTYPTEPEETRARLLFDDPLATSAVMVRRKVFVENEIEFRQEYPPAEDYDAWERLAQHGEIVNLDQVFTHYRIHANQSSTAGRERQIESVKKIQKRQLDRFGIEANEDEYEIHLRFGMSAYLIEASFVDAAEAWLRKLLEHNEKNGHYEKQAFRNVVADRWYRVNYAGWRQGSSALRKYRSSDLASLVGARRISFGAFALRCGFASFQQFMRKPGPSSGTI